VDNIGMDLGEVRCRCGLEQVENSCEFGIEPLGSTKCWETIKWPNSWLLLEQCSAS
jgi:hypothetical protein